MDARILACAAGLLLGCTTYSSSRPLSGQPPRPAVSGIYISAAPPRAAYRTVGFVQISTHGSTLPDIAGVSDTELDPAVHGLLAKAARDAGAEGAILIDAEDVMPPLPATRPWAMERGAPGRVRTRARWLEVHAELFVFLRDAAQGSRP